MRIEIIGHCHDHIPVVTRPRPPAPASSRDGAPSRATVEVSPHGERSPPATAR